jgi:hypothetical protein
MLRQKIRIHVDDFIATLSLEPQPTNRFTDWINVDVPAPEAEIFFKT